jgi:ZIP family zinc transporter
MMMAFLFLKWSMAMHTILPHQVLIAFAVTLLAGLATVIGGALVLF